MTVHEKFVADMRLAGIPTAAYRGRFFWEGPAARSDEQNGPTLQDIIGETAVPLQWDSLDSSYMVYPVGQATQNGRMPVPSQKATMLKRTVTTTPTLPRSPKTVTKKTRIETTQSGQARHPAFRLKPRLRSPESL
jgi:hypothetical protein